MWGGRVGEVVPFIKSLTMKVGMLGVGIGWVMLLGWPNPPKEVPDYPALTASSPLPSVLNGLPGPAAEAQKEIPPGDEAATPKHIPVKNLKHSEPTRTVKGQSIHQGAFLDINRATQEELEQVPGVGSVLAGRIIGYRQAHGPFRRLDDLEEVKGIGRKRVEQLRSRVGVNIRQS